MESREGRVCPLNCQHRFRNKKKVLFLGANLIGVKCLVAMVAHPGIEVAGVLPRTSDNGTISDKNAWNYSVRRHCNETGLFVHREDYANSDKFFEWASCREPDYIISVQYDKILNCRIIELPKLGCLNLHFSLLPYGRGCCPIPWAIIDNKPAGSTLHYINRGIVTGPIVGQIQTEYSYSDTAYDVYMRTVDNAAKLFSENLDKIASGNIALREQPKKEHEYHPKGPPWGGEINWGWPGEKIDRFVRANTFPGFRSAITFIAGDEQIEIKHPIKIKNGNHGSIKKVGEVLLVGNDFFDVSIPGGKVTVNSCSLTKPYDMFLKQGDVLT